MSLFKQLWFAIIVLLILVFGGSFVVNSLAAKNYLEQQLYIKNADNATALALSLTQQGADPVLLELTLSAQFDTGHYELIELHDPNGQIIIRRQDKQSITEAPAWFMSLLPIKVEPGYAEIQSGWQQVGTLTLRSHSRFAYGELWRSTRNTALVFLVAMLASGLIGRLLLQLILRPLDEVVAQAEAIGNRRFITTEEPYTLEFRQLVAAMNALSARIKAMLTEEAKRLEKWQRQSTVDRVTGLTERDPFLKTLGAALESDDVNATGTLVLLRLSRLSYLNQVYGRKSVDGLLAELGKVLLQLAANHSRWAAARLNGSDIAILAPRAMNPEEIAREVQATVEASLRVREMTNDTKVPTAATVYFHGDNIARVMTRLDASLMTAESSGSSEINIAREGDVQMLPMREQLDTWRKRLQQAMDKDQFRLAEFPVVDFTDKLIHIEAPVRLQEGMDLVPAGAFLPWVNRLELSHQLDVHVLDLALRLMTVQQKPMCVNLSVAAVVEPSFPAWLSERLSQSTEAAALLSIEVAEAMVFRHLENFKRLCEHAKLFGVKVGIEHMGHQLSGMGQLHDIGLDYIKIDMNFVRDVDLNPANQTLLRTLSTLGHSIGLQVIAEGVRSEAERAVLESIGLDGYTGPLVDKRKKTARQTP